VASVVAEGSEEAEAVVEHLGIPRLEHSSLTAREVPLQVIERLGSHCRALNLPYKCSERGSLFRLAPLGASTRLYSMIYFNSETERAIGDDYLPARDCQGFTWLDN
jgi:hypothetical protein